MWRHVYAWNDKLIVVFPYASFSYTLNITLENLNVRRNSSISCFQFQRSMTRTNGVSMRRPGDKIFLLRPKFGDESKASFGNYFWMKGTGWWNKCRQCGLSMSHALIGPLLSKLRKSGSTTKRAWDLWNHTRPILVYAQLLVNKSCGLKRVWS